MVRHDPDNYYEYDSGMIKCGECLDEDLRKTESGEYVEDERVYQGMFTRLHDDRSEPYQCDECNKQNEPYESLDPEKWPHEGY